ncbi:MAG: hypothetical protein HWN67_14980 [Candidatus Helarchaeota archaeon]|nr:hypothetical protein [Candidatus Helarchaeota archaeon]
MENIKIKKPPKEIKVVKLKRSPKEWEKIISEAKNKEMTWKYMREYYGDEVPDREYEST